MNPKSRTPRSLGSKPTPRGQRRRRLFVTPRIPANRICGAAIFRQRAGSDINALSVALNATGLSRCMA
jgi:hypothetical protein